MIKARTKYPTNLYGTIYIDNIQKAVVICLIIPTIFTFDAGSSIEKNTRMHDVRCPPWFRNLVCDCAVWFIYGQNINKTTIV